MAKKSYVYILASRKDGVLYIGITTDLLERVYLHKMGEYKGFTRKYNVTRLVYFEVYSKVVDAIAREKQLKGWRRAWKIALFEKINPSWQDLYFELLHQSKKKS